MPAKFSQLKDFLFKGTTACMASSVVFFMAAILAVLLYSAWPSILYNGVTFLTSMTWNMGNFYASGFSKINGVTAAPGASFGILVFLAGTIITSILALILAVPVSLGVAVFLTRFAPPFLRVPLSTLVELLAGVPSVVYGLWGWVAIVPWVSGGLGNSIKALLGWIPFFAGAVGTGMGLLASGIVLGIMIIPIITAITRDALANTPSALIEQGRALGTTEWEVIRDIILPHSRANIMGGIILGLGRAMGETMAILMVSGNALNYLPTNIFSPVGTIAAAIVSLLDSAMTDTTGMAIHALAEMALVLFLLTLLVNLLPPYIMKRRGDRIGAKEIADAPFREVEP